MYILHKIHNTQSFTLNLRMENMFTVDKTVPAAEISFNRQSVDNKYFSELLDVTVTIREHNFDPAGVTATLTGTSCFSE